MTHSSVYNELDMAKTSGKAERFLSWQRRHATLNNACLSLVQELYALLCELAPRDPDATIRVLLIAHPAPTSQPEDELSFSAADQAELAMLRARETLLTAQVAAAKASLGG